MKTTAILLLLTLIATGIWIGTAFGWLALALYLLTLTVVSFVLDVIAAARSIDNAETTGNK